MILSQYTKIFLSLLTTTALIGLWVGFVFAAEVEIDASVDTGDQGYNYTSPTHVWVSDTTAYVFWMENNAGMKVSSTTDSGATWSTSGLISSQTDIQKFAVWYDKWTPGDTGDKIHVAFFDSGVDDTYYIEYDTSTDSASTEALTGTESGTLGGNNDLSVTKGTDGILYITAVDAADSWVHTCSSSCTSGGNWSAITDPWGSADGNDGPMLFPLAGGDIMLVTYDISAHDIDSNVWNGSTWSGLSGFDTDVPDTTNYDMGPVGATIGTTTGEVWVAYCEGCNDYSIEDHDIEVWKYDGSWNKKTNIDISTGGITNVTMGIDKNNGTLYVAYVRRTTITTATTGNIYYVSSSDGGQTWSSQSSALNSTADDIRGLSMNIISDERLSVTWKYITSPNADDLMHETVADLDPGGEPPASPSASSTQNIRGGGIIMQGGGLIIR